MNKDHTEGPSPVRVRFAPSPTGLLHIGGLRTALYNYLFARKHGGTFIVRIEDTDRTRYDPEAEDDILDSLTWAGISFDEGPRIGGPHEPYYQSQRKDGYLEHASRLFEAGHAYYAFDTPEQITDMRERLQKAGNPSPRYDAITRMSMRNSITLPHDEVAKLLEDGAPYVIRLKVPRRETIRFEDMVRGWISFESAGLDDQVLIKSDGMPTYHLANVVDDHNMGITHVIRGEEWLSSTPKHILLYKYLGWDPPKMAHLPLILSPKGGKLSKRNADELGIPVSVRQYREAGYEPGALCNFLALLGWNPGDERERFNLEELASAFSVDRVGSSGVQFNLDKLSWFNQQLLRDMDPAELVQRAGDWPAAHRSHVTQEYRNRVVSLLQDRISFASDLPSFGSYFFEDFQSYDEKGFGRLKAEAAEFVVALASTIESDTTDSFSSEQAEQFVAETAATLDVKPGKLMFPARLALTGMTVGPALFDTMSMLGRDTCTRRLRDAGLAFGTSE